MNGDEPELPATPLALPRGVRAGRANLVHVNFVPTQTSLPAIAGPTDGHARTSPDAHRFNASRAEAAAAIAEWRAFVDEVRARKASRSR